jgi:hypothetical protein
VTPRRRTGLTWLLAAALVTALCVSGATAAAGGQRVLTVAQAKKLFLKKSKAQKTYVTKGEAAATYLPRVAQTRVSVPLTSWKLSDNTSNAPVVVNDTDVLLAKDSTPAQDVDYFAQVPVPTVIGGAPLKVVGIEICYDIPAVALTEPIIDRIALQRAVRSPSTVAPVGLTNLAADDTGRVDSACTTVSFAPVALLANDIVGVGLRVDFPDANTQLRMGASTLILTG